MMLRRFEGFLIAIYTLYIRVWKTFIRHLERIFSEYLEHIPRIYLEYSRNIPRIYQMFGKSQQAYISGDSGLIGNSVQREPEWNKEQETCSLSFLVTYFALELSETPWVHIQDSNWTDFPELKHSVCEPVQTFGVRTVKFWTSVSFSCLGYCWYKSQRAVRANWAHHAKNGRSTFTI